MTEAPPVMAMGSTLLFLWRNLVSKHRQAPVFLSPQLPKTLHTVSKERVQTGAVLTPLCSLSLARLTRSKASFALTLVPILPCLINADSSVSVDQKLQVRGSMQSTMHPDDCYDYFREKTVLLAVFFISTFPYNCNLS